MNNGALKKVEPTLITLTKNTWSNLGHKLVISWSFDGVPFGEDLTNVIVISWS